MSTQFKVKKSGGISPRGTGSRGIEWTDETRNAIGGCTHDCKWRMPDGTIAVCYAKTVAESVYTKAAFPQGFEHHYFRARGLAGLGAGIKPRLIFIDSMSDLFAADVPDAEIRQVLAAIAAAPHHAYQSLTKAAPRLLKFTQHMPPNLWVGASTPPDFFKGHELSRRQQQAMLATTLEALREVKQRTGNLVWLSAEPLSWDIAPTLGDDHGLDWLVIGAASRGRTYFQPDPAHVKNLLDVMDFRLFGCPGTPVFFKGNLRPLFAQHDFGTPALNRWREDFPTHRDGSAIAAVMARQEDCLRYGWTPDARLSLPVIEAAPTAEASVASA